VDVGVGSGVGMDVVSGVGVGGEKLPFSSSTLLIARRRKGLWQQKQKISFSRRSLLPLYFFYLNYKSKIFFLSSF
jgi:hypothetical protein